jgi:hypothetical protein
MESIYQDVGGAMIEWPTNQKILSGARSSSEEAEGILSDRLRTFLRSKHMWMLNLKLFFFFKGKSSKISCSDPACARAE